MDEFILRAIAQARQGLKEGGIPIGSVLVREGMILGQGYIDALPLNQIFDKLRCRL